MKFKMPVAKRERMEQLLEYLGDTSRYSEYYDGNRVEDFKKCFDIESEWCWKYADLMLRGMEKRELEYGEGHHIVPYSFYALNANVVHRKSPKYCDGNITVMTYGEHTYAHFCSAMCSTGELQYKMAKAFFHMFHYRSKILPEDEYVLKAISSEDYDSVRRMIPAITKVDDEGRTHSWEDQRQARIDYYNANKDDIKRKVRENYLENREHYIQQKKEYTEKNNEVIKQKRMERYQKNKEIYTARNKNYREAHKEELRLKDSEYYYANHEKIREAAKLYRITHLDKIRQREREYRQKNLEKCRRKSREYYHAHADELNRKQREYNQKPEVKARRIAQQKNYREVNCDKIRESRKRYREENKDVIREKKMKFYYENHEKILAKKREYNALHKEERSIKAKQYRIDHRDMLIGAQKARYDEMVSSGYRYRKDPLTGKRGWIFAGIPEKEAAA